MIMKRFFLFFVFVGFLSLQIVSAFDFEVNGIYYNIIQGTKNVEVTFKEGGISGDYIGKVEIPNTVVNKGIVYNVTRIGKSTFSRCNRLTSIIIPDGIISIEDFAFSVSAIASIVLPNSVTSIGTMAFYGCMGLTSISIPEGMRNIARQTFGECRNLNTVTLKEGIQSIGEKAFENCESLTMMGVAVY